MDNRLPAKPIAVGRTAQVFVWGEGHILKLYHAWCPANWIESEIKIGRIVQAAQLPVPAIGEIVEIAGRRGIVYERIVGNSMLNQFKQRLWAIPRFARLFAELHATMHNQTVPADLPTQRAQLTHAIQHAPGLEEVAREHVLQKLDAMPESQQLCHGDFHPGNVLLTTRGPIIIDWMTASRGNPNADLARTLLLLNLGDPPSAFERFIAKYARRTFVTNYLARYFELCPDAKTQFAAWQPIITAARLNEDIPGEREHLLKLIQTTSSSLG